MDQLDEFDIRQYIDALRRRWWVIALAVVVCVGAAAAYSFTAPKIYEATNEVIISAQQESTGTANALSDPNQLQNQMQTQVRIVEGRDVSDDAGRQLGADSERVIDIRAEGQTNTRVLAITASSEDPGVAQRAADVYAGAYLAETANLAVERVQSLNTQVQQTTAQLQTQIDQARTELASAPASTRNGIQSNIDNLQAQVDQINAAYDDARAQALVREATASPFASAELPEEPVAPTPARNLALALVLGLLIGIGIALIWERLDDRIRNSDQLSRWFPKYTTLGAIPKVADWKNADDAFNVVLADPQSQTAEAYRGLRTSLEFMGIDQELKVIEVTSATAGEGKSTTVANLATAMAWAGNNVIIVSADLRRPRVHQFFGVGNEKGLTSLLVDKTLAIESVLEEASISTHEGWVRVLPTGPLPPNPSELLGSQAFAELITKMKALADYVIIDAPPLLPVADPLVLSRYADGIVVVAGVGHLRKGELSNAFDTLEKTPLAPVLGIVLNNSEEALAYNKKYGDYAAAPSALTQ